MALLDSLKNCVICDEVRISYSDMMLFLEDKRVYKISCKCRKNVMGADLEGVVSEWNKLAQLENREDFGCEQP